MEQTKLFFTFNPPQAKCNMEEWETHPWVEWLTLPGKGMPHKGDEVVGVTATIPWLGGGEVVTQPTFFLNPLDWVILISSKS
jgi:hypothetical protein